MRTDLVLTAYDVMGEVWVSIVVRQTSDTEQARSEPVVRSSTTIQGSGEADPTEWARDALVGMLEVL